MNPETNPPADTAATNPATEKNPAEPRDHRNDSAAYRPPALEFPQTEPWSDPVDGQVLLRELERVLNRYVVLPAGASTTVALWILHTYAFQLRDVSTYLGVESPEKRCGKTTLLTLLLELVHRPIVAANISSPAFFRLIAEARPTLLIDEADTLLKGNDELRGILNSGYTRKTAYVVRVAQQVSANPLALARFSCWCPKIMAAIGRLPETLADRCILIRMQRKTPGEVCDRLRNLDLAHFQRRCTRFVLDHAKTIAAARPQLPEGLNDRAGDIWEPLLVLADLAGGDWPQKARQSALNFSAAPYQSGFMAALLLDICAIFSRLNGDRIHSRLLVSCLNLLTDRPWRELNKHQPITESWLAHRLRHYGISPKTIRLGPDVAKGYVREDFTDAFSRYIPRADFQALVAEINKAAPPPGGNPNK